MLDKNRWKPWSSGDVERLKDLLNKGYFNYQIAAELNRSVESISYKRIKLGLAKRTFDISKWTDDEDSLLKQYTDNKLPFWEIAKKLNKTKKQVQYKAKKMGIITFTYFKRGEKEDFIKKYKNDPTAHLIVKRFGAAKSRAKNRNIELNITRDFLMEIYNR
jgi:hypothetical protein